MLNTDVCLLILETAVYFMRDSNPHCLQNGCFYLRPVVIPVEFWAEVCFALA